MKLVAEKESLDLHRESDATTAREKSISLIEEVVIQEKERGGSLYTHDRFFKQSATNAKIRAHILNKYS
jgi:hypothetical protein